MTVAWVTAAADICVHEPLTTGARMWVLRCEIAGPTGVSMCSICWFCQCGTRIRGFSCHFSPGDRKGNRMSFSSPPHQHWISQLNLPLIEKYIAFIHIPLASNEAGHPFACLLGVSVYIVFWHPLPIFLTDCLLLSFWFLLVFRVCGINSFSYIADVFPQFIICHINIYMFSYILLK